MGISASVMCTCYPEGKTSPCPFPDAFQYDPTRMPAVDWDAVTDDPDERVAMQAQFQAWLGTCCAHRGMAAAEAFIASWRGLRQFTEALDALGEDHFPLLSAHLPEGEDGLTTPAQAAQMLAEIDRLQALQAQVLQTVLVDTERDEDISMGSAVLGGVLALDNNTGLDLGFDDEGFFIRDRWELNRQMFRARRVRQTLLYPDIPQVEYCDEDSGVCFVCATPFGNLITGDDGQARMRLARFAVVQRPLAAGRFDYLLRPLKHVLETSVAIGNPVRWH